MKKRILTIVLSIICVTCFSLFFVGCINNTSSNDDQIVAIYNTYVSYAQSNGQTPLSYEEWFASIKGEKGDKGDKGNDGKGIKSAVIDNNGNLIITFDDNSWVNAGNIIPKNPILDENNKIVFNNIAIVGNKGFIQVDNETTSFSFLDEIEIMGCANYTVSTDITGLNVIPTKTVNLAIGNNVFYVLETCGNDANLYTITIRRELPKHSKKAVSVMFDNSGSMNGAHHKFEYALYSMQMLMALLNEGDTLVITPMNTYSAVQVDLSATDRNAEIQRIIGIMETMTSPLGTPHAPIGDAVNELVGQGLKTKENLLDEPENIDYWLIVLTDGAFNNYKGKADEAVEQYIDKYPSLNTIYLGFVDADDLSNSPITNKYKFTPYLAKDPDSITDVMTSVSNQMSGRYAFDSSVYSISGNKLTIDLDKCAFSLKSLSVVTQNCDAVISSAKYNGVSVGTKLPCVISPSTVLGMKSGYSATIEGNPYLSGGKLEIEYSAPIDQVSILAEPALKMEAVLDRLDGSDWVPTDIQYINANLKPGAVIRVGYKVYEQANSSLIDLEKVFGTATTKVTYAGNSCQCGDKITLVKGVNEIGTSVSVMGGTYTMYSTLTCVVEDNPTDYRIEAEYSGRLDVNAKTLKSKYIVYYDDKPLTKAQFAEFTIEAKTTDSFGKESPTQYVIENDGKVSVTTTFNKLEYDVFTEYFKVTSSKKIYRDFKTETYIKWQ